jgi:hypothetical protein
MRANLGGQLGELSSGVSNFPDKPSGLNELRCIRGQSARHWTTNGWAVGWADLLADAQAVDSCLSSNSCLGPGRTNADLDTESPQGGTPHSELPTTPGKRARLTTLVSQGLDAPRLSQAYLLGSRPPISPGWYVAAARRAAFDHKEDFDSCTSE